ncbi:MAG: carbamoyltransferase HypF [Candidatus Omnitrophica bacterium]|nr:carbamoyltransferase HypF [Candidatus Omnitrophota bacterium]
MRNKTILALGSDIKNRFLVAKGKTFCFGPDIGDLADPKNYARLKKEVRKVIKKFKPDIIAHDLHPAYFSTRFARELALRLPGARLLGVQHHHAHIASVLFEKRLNKPVIGVSFDGTGFGSDGNIWGGEFLLVYKGTFKRIGYLKYQKMPGGDKVVFEPWRMILAILGEEGKGFIKGVQKNDKDLVLKMIKKNINCPESSSAGRLFDATAALLGICTKPSFEAEGPINLEKLCKKSIKQRYGYAVREEKGCSIIDTSSLFRDMVKDIKKGTPLNSISTKFHNSMVDIIIDTVKKSSQKLKTDDIVLSGGVFGNNFLKSEVIKKLSLANFNVFTNSATPVNDFNIAIGQYCVSCNIDV